jgi:HEAT repeats
MPEHRRSLLLPVLSTLLLLASSGASAGENDRTLLRELLAFRAPPADWRVRAEAWNDTLPAGQRIGRDDVPEDGAARDILIAFWGDDWTWLERRKMRPSPKVRERLLKACIEKPELLRNLIRFLPDTHEVHERLTNLVGDPISQLSSDKPWRRLSGEWLLVRCADLIPQLAEVADRTHDGEWLVQGWNFLTALAESDWPAAEPVLHKLMEGDQPKTKALVVSLRYRHAIRAGQGDRAAEWRERLKCIVEDPRQPGQARHSAFDELMRSEWSRRDDWYLSLLSAPTFREAREGIFCWRTLAKPVQEDPDRWIPVVTRLIGHEDRSVHNAAVTCLIQFQLEHARADALRPLLPWLKDPDWCDVQAFRAREHLIRSLDPTEFPESFVDLVRIVETEHEFERGAAAAALGRFADPRAIPALRSTLDRASETENRDTILWALIACGGLTDEEIARSIVAYAKYDPDGEEAQEYDRRFTFRPDSDLPSNLLTGKVMKAPEFATESRAKALVAWCVANEKPDPPTLEALTKTLAARQIVVDILARWDTPTAIRFAVRRLGEHRLSAKGTVSLLENRERVLACASRPLHEMLGTKSVQAGIAAALIGSPAAHATILDGSEGRGQSGLLAAARAIRQGLPLEKVARLLDSEDDELAAAAEAYLVAEDGPEARRLVWARHPGEALILGGEGGYSSRFERVEEELRRVILAKNGPDEVFGIAFRSEWKAPGSIIVQVRDGKAESPVVAGCLQHCRRLDGGDVAHLRNWLADNEVESLPPLNLVMTGGTRYEYIRLTREGGVRVCMNNPGSGPPWDIRYSRLVRRFRALSGE